MSDAPPPDPISSRFGIILNDREDNAEDLLARVVGTLLAEGHVLGGLCQVTTRLPGGQNRMELVDITTGIRHRISQDLGPASTACCLDPGALVEASAILRRAIARPVALLVVNKFAGLEMDGRGFAPDAFEALTRGIPVLTCLSRQYREKFGAVSGGLGTCLPPEHGAVVRWARQVLATAGQQETSA